MRSRLAYALAAVGLAVLLTAACGFGAPHNLVLHGAVVYEMIRDPITGAFDAAQPEPTG